MVEFGNIPKKYINQLAKMSKVKFTGRFTEEVIEDLVKLNHGDNINYLNEQFKFPSAYLTILKAESNFPEKSKTPEKYLNTLIKEGLIKVSEINTEWEPSLSSDIKICAIKHEGSSIYLKLVEERSTTRKSGYRTTISSYAHFTSIVLHFGEDELIELRCSYTEIKKYAEFIMKLMGFAAPYKWFAVPKLTIEAAKKLCDILSAGVASTHIALPSTVGSLKFNGKKGVNLVKDNTFNSITSAIQGLGLPTDQTMDDNCFFSYIDGKTNIIIDVTFEVNIQSSYFKFTSNVPEMVIDHVLDALVKVSNDSTIVSVVSNK